MTGPAKPIEDFLTRARFPFTTFRHRPAYTAQEEAAVSHAPGRCWAKTVLCFADEEPVQAVLAAPSKVDLERLRRISGARHLRLASEDEVARTYPECELGAMPPLGPMYKQRVFLDIGLTGDPEIVFDAGTHTEAVRIHYQDYIDLVNPVVAAFAQPSPVSRPL